MSGVVSVLFVIVMFVLLIWAIMKKLQLVMVLWTIGTVALILVAIINSTSPVATSRGNMILDAFEYYKECIAKQFSTNALIIMCVMGYVAYMNHLKAGDLFAVYVARPLKKLRIKYLVVGLVVVLDWIFVMILPSGITTIALMLGTIYPIMLYLGIERLTAGCAIIVGIGVFATPVNMFPAQMLTNLEMDLSLSEAFVKYMLPVTLIMEVFFALAYVIQSKILDKKAEGSVNSEEIKEIPSPDSFGIPKFYALFPLIPFENHHCI